MSTIKSYVLFPHWRGTLSTRCDDYGGTRYTVAATSIRQAYALAHQRVWIDPHDGHPVGIVSVHRRTTGITLWCGCSGHDVAGGQVSRAAGITAIRKAIDAHHCARQKPRVSLRDRLLAAAAGVTDRQA